MPGVFDAVTCMEMLEHVPDPAAVIRACATLLKPGGRLFVSTLNRTPAAFALAIVGAEYVARLLPKGTHQYRDFIKPFRTRGMAARGGPRTGGRQRARVRAAGATRRGSSRRTDVNYLVCARKPERGMKKPVRAARSPRWCCSTWTARCSTARPTCWPRSTRCAHARGLAPMRWRDLRPHVSSGARAMVAAAFPHSTRLRARRWIREFLDDLRARARPARRAVRRHRGAARGDRGRGSRWGIVTNKPEYLARRADAASWDGNRAARC